MSTQLVQRSDEDIGSKSASDNRRMRRVSGAAIAGWILTGLASALLLLDAVMKFVQPVEVVETTILLGYEKHVILPIGVTLLVSTLLYLLPQTAVLGAILLTGYLGGAVATHVRVGNPPFTHTLFPVYFGVLIWLGLYLRDPRLRALLPLRRRG